MSVEPTVWTKFKDFMGGTVIKTMTEIHLLMPDSILFGSLLLYFVTQNLAFGVFGIFIFETVLSHRLISWITSQSVGPSRSVDIQCRSGFKVAQLTPQRIFSHDSYPSYSTYSIVAIAVYLAMATREFTETMKAMGPEWSSRSMAAYSFIGLVVATFVIARWLTCDSMSEIILASVFALISGFIFFYLNKAIFGEEAMNFLGLPYMVSKESTGSPIYVCAAENTK